MRRFSILLSVLVVALGTAIVLWQPTTLAQEATPTAMGNHPVVGAWQLENDTGGGDTFTSYAVFLPDGTYLEATYDGATLVGVWRATGERTADLTLFAADIDPAPNAITLGEGRFTVEVDAAGMMTHQGAFQARQPDGTVAFTAGGLISHGTRLEVAPEPFSTLAAATPAP